MAELAPRPPPGGVYDIVLHSAVLYQRYRKYFIFVQVWDVIFTKLLPLAGWSALLGYALIQRAWWAVGAWGLGAGFFALDFLGYHWAIWLAIAFSFPVLGWSFWDSTRDERQAKQSKQQAKTAPKTDL